MKNLFTIKLLAFAMAGLFAQSAYSFGFDDLKNLDLDKLVNIAKKTEDLKPVDNNAEAEIGKGVAANLLGAAPLVQNEPLQRYVNQLGTWLAMQGERPEVKWRFAVIDSDGVNAFAAPGGYVFVTKGMLLRMRNEAELAGVLSHEIAHVLKKHHLNAIQKSSQTSIMGDLASMAIDTKQYGDLAKKAISAGTELYARGLDKEDEYEADRMGVVIAAKAGYDPYGLPAVLQTLEAINPQDSGLALMTKTHPTPTARLQRLDSLMNKNLDKYATQPQVEERFVQTVGNYAR